MQSRGAPASPRAGKRNAWLAFGAISGVRGDGAAEIRDSAADFHEVVIAEGDAVVEGRKADHRRGRREIGVVERQYRTSPAKQPAGFETDPGAAPRHLHATGVRLQQLAVHHFGDQLWAVES